MSSCLYICPLAISQMTAMCSIEDRSSRNDIEALSHWMLQELELFLLVIAIQRLLRQFKDRPQM